MAITIDPTTLGFHAMILVFSVLHLYVAASHANYSRPVVVVGHHHAPVISSVFGTAADYRFSRPLPHLHLATALCALEKDEEDRMLLLESQQPPRRRHLPMDWGSRLLRTIPDRNDRGANYTVLLVAERPSLAVNFVVDGPARTGLLLSSTRSPLVCNQNLSLRHSNISPSASRFILLIVAANSSGEGVAHSFLIAYNYKPTVFHGQEEILEYASLYRIMPVNDTFHDRRVQRHRSSSTLPGSNQELPRTRKLLSGGSHGHNSPTKQQHVAIYRQSLRRTRRFRASVAIAGSTLLGLICAVAAGVLLCCTRRKRMRRSAAAMAIELEELEDNKPILKPEQFGRLTWPRRFLYREMAAATRNFAQDNKIGRGGFGPVYQGYLNDEQRHVAIKVLTEREQSHQGMREFQAELTVMSQVRHRNIVQLLGWCDCRRGLFLVYELMPEGSLDKHLYDTDRLLSWPDRYNIALGLGSALQYLHQDCDQCVVHGDIKPANVMLDTSRNAKLGDFGLARLVDHGAEPHTTQVVAGTVGYIDPEFINSHRPSTESDVYSFGVVLLEIACGRRPVSLSLLNFVRGMYDRGTVLEAAEGRMNGEFDERQMERVLVTGLWCACRDPTCRPSIAQAVEALRSEGAELPVITPATRSLVEQAYGDLSVEISVPDPSTAYLTSTDSTCLLVHVEE